MSWREACLSDLVFFQRGYDITKDKQVDGGVPVISSSGINSFHTEARAKGPGVVIGRKGSLGSVFYAEEDYWPHDTTLWSKDLKENDAKYVYYYLKTLNLEKFNVGNSNPTLNRNHIHNLRIMIPDLPKQRSISSCLSNYDSLIENNRRRIELLEQTARLLYKEWFVHFRFPGHEHVKIVDGVPKGWTTVTIRDITDILSGFAFQSKAYQTEGTYGIVTIKNVQQSQFIPDCSSFIDVIPNNMPPHCHIKTGDILLSLTGNIGRVCIVYGDNYLLNQRVAKLSARTDIPSSYLYWLFSEDGMQRKLENLSYGVAQQNLSPVKLAEQRVYLPSKALLEEFDNFAADILSLVSTLNLTNQRLKQARDLLLPRLMNGEVAI